MLKRIFFLLSIISVTTSVMFAQNGEDRPTHAQFNFEKSGDTEIVLSGNLKTDQKITFNAISSEISKINLNQEPDNKKSPWLGALFSFLLPGSGQFYAESYWKAGIFLALEAAVVTTAVIYNNKGIKQTDDFERYANNITDKTGWSAVRYADWLNQYYGGNISINQNTSLPAWERVSFAEINAVESDPNNSELSHQLAPYGEQQYYEMIGKYHQFRAGWGDYNGGIAFEVSNQFLTYAGMRGKANDYFSVASTAVIGIYINHFLSAIDAYWSTTIYNKELIAKITVENKQYANLIELVPTLKVKFNF